MNGINANGTNIWQGTVCIKKTYSVQARYPTQAAKKINKKVN